MSVKTPSINFIKRTCKKKNQWLTSWCTFWYIAIVRWAQRTWKKKYPSQLHYKTTNDIQPSQLWKKIKIWKKGQTKSQKNEVQGWLSFQSSVRVLCQSLSGPSTNTLDYNIYYFQVEKEKWNCISNCPLDSWYNLWQSDGWRCVKRILENQKLSIFKSSSILSFTCKSEREENTYIRMFVVSFKTI